jgi:Tfp pilus assembly protein PilF
VQIWNDLGLAQESAGIWRDAIPSFETAIRLDPSKYEAHLNLAVVCMRHRMTGRAQSEFAEAVHAAPGEPLVYTSYAAALLDVGELAAAREQLTHAVNLDPRLGSTWAELARLEAADGRHEAALAHFARAESLGVAAASFQANYGLELLRAKDYRAAVARLETAARLDTARAAVWNHLGVAHNQLGNDAAALDALRRARRLDPANEDYRFNLASVLFRLRRWDDVVREVSAPRPQRADLLDLWGMAVRSTSGAEAALPLVREAAERAPRNTNVLNNYGVVLAECGRVDEARDVWLRVLRVEPANVTARQNLEARGGVPEGVRRPQ